MQTKVRKKVMPGNQPGSQKKGGKIRLILKKACHTKNLHSVTKQTSYKVELVKILLSLVLIVS